jgi:hypothetical protein
VAEPADNVDRIVAWLEENRAEIGRIRFGRVLLDLYGDDEIKGRVEWAEKLPPADRLARSSG